MPLLDPVLKEALVCPQCHGELIENEAQEILTCAVCNLAYPVQDGIPIMLPEEAKPIPEPSK